MYGMQKLQEIHTATGRHCAATNLETNAQTRRRIEVILAGDHFFHVIQGIVTHLLMCTFNEVKS